MNELERILRKELYRKSLYEFVKAFWQEADSSVFMEAPLFEFYCETFQYYCKNFIPCECAKNVILPESNDNIVIIDVRNWKDSLNINVPPRHAKSMIFNVLGPLWAWTFATISVTSVSHTRALSDEMQRKRKKVIDSEKYQEIFGNEIQIIKNTESMILDSRGTKLFSCPMDAMTGYGSDIIVCDDLTNAQSATKDMKILQNAKNFYRNTLPSRFNNPSKKLLLAIHQRLAPSDITGSILEDEKLASTYTFIVLSAIMEKDTYVVMPISGKIIFYPKGSGLWEDRWGNYESLRISAGESVFQTQYLQKPVDADSTIVKEDMIIEKDIVDVPSIDYADMIYASHDFPVKDKESSDNLGSCVAYKVGATLYIFEALEKKMAFVKGVEYVRQLDDLYPGCIQIAEDKANGTPIIESLRNEVPGLQAYQPGTQSKNQRLETASLYMISGNVIFVRTRYNKDTNKYSRSEGINNLIQRLIAFPFVDHDDVVDSFSQLLMFVFMERRNMVYGRSFNNELNMIDFNEVANDVKYSNVFFNKEGDIWKVLEIYVKYSSDKNKLYVSRETIFRATINDGIKKLEEFAPNQRVFIDCSSSESLYGLFKNNVYVERYEVDDFDKSVGKLNENFANRNILIDKKCKKLVGDIENFKYARTKNDNEVKYKTQKDGFVACLRIAMKYFSI